MLNRLKRCKCILKSPIIAMLHTNLLKYFAYHISEKLPSHKKNRVFIEGWVEFLDKKIAKSVALALNNNKVGGKKRNRWYEELWNIKYLHRFKWGHLNEKLAYERAVHNQRLRTEISQVKKESHFFVSNVEKKQRIKKYESKQKTELPVREWTFQQRDTEEEILSKKRKLEEKGHKVPGAKKSDSKSGDKKRLALDTKFLSTLFSGGVENDEDS